MRKSLHGLNSPSAAEDTAGFTRRNFLTVCTLAAAALGLPAWAGRAMAAALEKGRKPSLIWLHFQECTGCTESLLRTSDPDVAELILDLISLDYHETLFAAAGTQIEDALQTAIEENRGQYILVVEGSIPTKDGGVYCQIGGRTAIEMLTETAEHAAAIIGIGSCAAWGGIPSADPNPTGAVGASDILKNKTVVNLPGCPANPYNLLGVALQYATFGTLPGLDKKGRPLFAYGRTIHEDCPRRPHFDAGRFAEQFGDAGHNEGYCLYRLGCKGPATHAGCALKPFGDIPGAWPIGVGHPCFGCSEQELAFRMPLFETIQIEHLTPPGNYPPIVSQRGVVHPAATAVAGVIGGALLGGGLMAAKKLSARSAEPEEPPPEEQEKEP